MYQRYAKFGKFLETKGLLLEWKKVYSYSKSEEGESSSDSSIKIKFFGNGSLCNALNYLSRWEEGNFKMALLQGKIDKLDPASFSSPKIQGFCQLVYPVMSEFVACMDTIELSVRDFFPVHVREAIIFGGASVKSVSALFKAASSLEREIPIDRTNLLYWREKYASTMERLPLEAKEACLVMVSVLDGLLESVA